MLIQTLCQRKFFFDLFKQQSRGTRHPSQFNDVIYRVYTHILCRRTPPPPERNLFLVDFAVITFFPWISTRSVSHEQWYNGSIELEVNFLKFLHEATFFIRTAIVFVWRFLKRNPENIIVRWWWSQTLLSLSSFRTISIHETAQKSTLSPSSANNGYIIGETPGKDRFYKYLLPSQNVLLICRCMHTELPVQIRNYLGSKVLNYLQWNYSWNYLQWKPAKSYLRSKNNSY